MERFTKKVDGVWTALCNYGSSPCPVVTQEIIDRLAAYEDTGLTPAEVQVMRWIPVEERLPKPQENPVIACDYTGVCLAWYSPTMGWQYRTGLSGVDITHWMPLPPARIHAGRVLPVLGPVPAAERIGQ